MAEKKNLLDQAQLDQASATARALGPESDQGSPRWVAGKGVVEGNESLQDVLKSMAKQISLAVAAKDPAIKANLISMIQARTGATDVEVKAALNQFVSTTNLPQAKPEAAPKPAEAPVATAGPASRRKPAQAPAQVEAPAAAQDNGPYTQREADIIRGGGITIEEAVADGLRIDSNGGLVYPDNSNPDGPYAGMVDDVEQDAANEGSEDATSAPTNLDTATDPRATVAQGTEQGTSKPLAAGSIPASGATDKVVGIIGTAGRKANNEVLTGEIFDGWVAKAASLVTPDTTLVSGGAAWADHVAVRLFLDGKVSGLILQLPTEFRRSALGLASKFVGGPPDTTSGETARIANYYHSLFSKAIGVNTLSEIQEAIDNGAIVESEPNESESGFKGRNTKIAQLAKDGLISFSKLQPDGTPIDGGTRDTWDKHARIHPNARRSAQLSVPKGPRALGPGNQSKSPAVADSPTPDMPDYLNDAPDMSQSDINTPFPDEKVPSVAENPLAAPSRKITPAVKTATTPEKGTTAAFDPTSVDPNSSRIWYYTFVTAKNPESPTGDRIIHSGTPGQGGYPAPRVASDRRSNLIKVTQGSRTSTTRAGRDDWAPNTEVGDVLNVGNDMKPVYVRLTGKYRMLGYDPDSGLVALFRVSDKKVVSLPIDYIATKEGYDTEAYAASKKSISTLRKVSIAPGSIPDARQAKQGPAPSPVTQPARVQTAVPPDPAPAAGARTAADIQSDLAAAFMMPASTQRSKILSGLATEMAAIESQAAAPAPEVPSTPAEVPAVATAKQPMRINRRGGTPPEAPAPELASLTPGQIPGPTFKDVKSGIEQVRSRPKLKINDVVSSNADPTELIRVNMYIKLIKALYAADKNGAGVGMAGVIDTIGQMKVAAKPSEYSPRQVKSAIEYVRRAFDERGAYMLDHVMKGIPPSSKASKQEVAIYKELQTEMHQRLSEAGWSSDSINMVSKIPLEDLIVGKNPKTWEAVHTPRVYGVLAALAAIEKNPEIAKAGAEFAPAIEYMIGEIAKSASILKGIEDKPNLYFKNMNAIDYEGLYSSLKSEASSTNPGNGWAGINRSRLSDLMDRISLSLVGEDRKAVFSSEDPDIRDYIPELVPEMSPEEQDQQIKSALRRINRAILSYQEANKDGIRTGVRDYWLDQNGYITPEQRFLDQNGFGDSYSGEEVHASIMYVPGTDGAMAIDANELRDGFEALQRRSSKLFPVISQSTPGTYDPNDMMYGWSDKVSPIDQAQRYTDEIILKGWKLYYIFNDSDVEQSFEIRYPSGKFLNPGAHTVTIKPGKAAIVTDEELKLIPATISKAAVELDKNMVSYRPVVKSKLAPVHIRGLRGDRVGVVRTDNKSFDLSDVTSDPKEMNGFVTIRKNTARYATDQRGQNVRLPVSTIKSTSDRTPGRGPKAMEVTILKGYEYTFVPSLVRAERKVLKTSTEKGITISTLDGSTMTYGADEMVPSGKIIIDYSRPIYETVTVPGAVMQYLQKVSSVGEKAARAYFLEGVEKLGKVRPRLASAVDAYDAWVSKPSNKKAASLIISGQYNGNIQTGNAVMSERTAVPYGPKPDEFVVEAGPGAIASGAPREFELGSTGDTQVSESIAGQIDYGAELRGQRKSEASLETQEGSLPEDISSEMLMAEMSSGVKAEERLMFTRDESPEMERRMFRHLDSGGKIFEYLLDGEEVGGIANPNTLEEVKAAAMEWVNNSGLSPEDVNKVAYRAINVANKWIENKNNGTSADREQLVINEVASRSSRTPLSDVINTPGKDAAVIDNELGEIEIPAEFLSAVESAEPRKIMAALAKTLYLIMFDAHKNIHFFHVKPRKDGKGIKDNKIIADALDATGIVSTQLIARENARQALYSATEERFSSLLVEALSREKDVDVKKRGIPSPQSEITFENSPSMANYVLANKDLQAKDKDLAARLADAFTERYLASINLGSGLDFTSQIPEDAIDMSNSGISSTPGFGSSLETISTKPNATTLAQALRPIREALKNKRFMEIFNSDEFILKNLETLKGLGLLNEERDVETGEPTGTYEFNEVALEKTGGKIPKGTVLIVPVDEEDIKLIKKSQTIEGNVLAPGEKPAKVKAIESPKTMYDELANLTKGNAPRAAKVVKLAHNYAMEKLATQKRGEFGQIVRLIERQGDAVRTSDVLDQAGFVELPDYIQEQAIEDFEKSLDKYPVVVDNTESDSTMYVINDFGKNNPVFADTFDDGAGEYGDDQGEPTWRQVFKNIAKGEGKGVKLVAVVDPNGSIRYGYLGLEPQYDQDGNIAAYLQKDSAATIATPQEMMQKLKDLGLQDYVDVVIDDLAPPLQEPGESLENFIDRQKQHQESVDRMLADGKVDQFDLTIAKSQFRVEMNRDAFQEGIVSIPNGSLFDSAVTTQFYQYLVGNSPEGTNLKALIPDSDSVLDKNGQLLPENELAISLANTAGDRLGVIKFRVNAKSKSMKAEAELRTVGSGRVGLRMLQAANESLDGDTASSGRARAIFDSAIMKAEQFGYKYATYQPGEAPAEETTKLKFPKLQRYGTGVLKGTVLASLMLAAISEARSGNLANENVPLDERLKSSAQAYAPMVGLVGATEALGRLPIKAGGPLAMAGLLGYSALSGHDVLRTAIGILGGTIAGVGVGALTGGTGALPASIAGGVLADEVYARLTGADSALTGESYGTMPKAVQEKPQPDQAPLASIEEKYKTGGF